MITVKATPFKYRLDLYEYLAANKEKILQEAERVGQALNVPSEIKGAFGTSGANSALPGTMRSDILRAIEKRMAKVETLRGLGDEIRRIVKSYYGDDYDAAPTNSCEAALGAVYAALLTPPLIGRGEPYRARCVGLLERHAEHHLSYGRPFPPMRKDMFADRGATAGELGVLGRSNLNTDIVFVPMTGASYPLHGIKSYPTALLAKTDAAATALGVRRAAQIHAANLSGFVSLGYDTRGYGYAEKAPDGAPALQRSIGEIAADFGVPYVSDNAWGMPFLGTDPRATRASVMLYSMDKVTGSPTSGLIIGREDAMVNVRRTLGIHGERFGATSAHGKASHVAADPGKMAMAGMLAALETLRERPEVVARPIDVTHEIVLDEYRAAQDALGDGIVITKSYNMGGVEINYEGTWSSQRFGIPIFNNEDRVAGSHLLNSCTAKMGALLGIADDGNVIVNPGLGTVDRSGTVIEDRMRLAVRILFRSMVLLREWSEKGPQ